MKCTNHATCKGYAEGRSKECRYCQEANRPAQDEQTIRRLEQKPRRVADVWGWGRGKRKP